MPDLPLFGPDADPAEALADLLAAGLGDGLPVVPPSAARLAAMVAGVGGPDAVLGQVPPLFGDLTVRAVAWYAVLAGCRPAELPVVVAAARAALEPEFNLLGIATTTGSPAVAVLVHGPVASSLGLTPVGGLGPGARANACVGRAVALALAGIGGARAGLTDMATIGQPGKYTFCTASLPGPFPPLAAGDAVTVVGASGVVEVLPASGYRTPAEVLAPAAAALAGVALAAGDPTRFRDGEQFLLLPPELAGFLDAHGWAGERAAEFLFAEGNALLAAAAARLSEVSSAYAAGDLRVAASADDVRVVVTGGLGVKMALLPTWMGGTRSVTAAVRALHDLTP
ncbi:hypothetical protein E4P41_03735 [Geodermatophilus sp. DF01-2]|uniref:hypothetical protein n=1 Tax=Geodermatophilus sp. DF01-2 TaxID=2559610 RepID=UPI0010742E81|nr:hypothetical protein [Geodermatophilus sp. DF01_2]TFV63837.1 hypothetical protein E4P41_03735 [Geodermatophilus sp. DF01_2]